MYFILSRIHYIITDLSLSPYDTHEFENIYFRYHTLFRTHVLYFSSFSFKVNLLGIVWNNIILLRLRKNNTFVHCIMYFTNTQFILLSLSLFPLYHNHAVVYNRGGVTQQTHRQYFSKHTQTEEERGTHTPQYIYSNRSGYPQS